MSTTLAASAPPSSPPSSPTTSPTTSPTASSDPAVSLVDETTGRAAAAPRTYLVKTLGCQMNVHDSEHMAGMLEQAGYVPAGPEQAAGEDADVIVINTCAVR